MSPNHATPAVVQAVPTHALTGVREPSAVAHELQTLMSSLISQGYEILGVSVLPTALLCSAIRREPDRALRWYGCEGVTCQVGRHTLDCPHIDRP